MAGLTAACEVPRRERERERRVVKEGRGWDS